MLSAGLKSRRWIVGGAIAAAGAVLALGLLLGAAARGQAAAGSAAGAGSAAAARATATGTPPELSDFVVGAQATPDARPLAIDRGAVGVWQALLKLHTRASLLMVVAHPDDEDGGMMAYEIARARRARRR